jgi:predicted transcriptional regulator
MRQAPCEYMMWNGLPVIRREIAECITKNFGLNQKETARKLGVTPAAVCQYLSKKRGKIKIIDEKVLKEISISAKRIIEDDGNSIITETCRLCKIMRSRGIFSFFCNACNTDE